MYFIAHRSPRCAPDGVRLDQILSAYFTAFYPATEIKFIAKHSLVSHLKSPQFQTYQLISVAPPVSTL
jgi:hypothetical protein